MDPHFLHLQAPQNFSVSVNPLVSLSILDYHIRSESGSRVIGVLLGSRSEDGTEVEVKNAFAVPFNQAEGSFDKDFYDDVYNLHRRVNAKEVPVGWYTTGPLDHIAADIHDAFAFETSPHAAVLLVADTTFSNDIPPLRAYSRTILGLAPGDNGPQGALFTQIPVDSKYFDAERTGLDVLAEARKAPTGAAPLLSDIDNLERAIIDVQSMLERVGAYVDKVSKGEIEGNKVIGRYLADTVASVPRIDAAAFEKTFSNHVQDLLMVVYLANLTRTQLAMGERLKGMNL